jgi:DNA (cytosine-5)-methyltransferase 1
MRTVAFCEIDEYARKVLSKHWPDVPIYHDVRELSADRLASDGISVDVICGGFPCQDISFAGKGAGLAGERSGLWREYARLIGELRPRFVIVENVAALLGRGMGDVLGDLAAIGYDAEWHCIPASAVGAPHRRDRIWVVAYPGGEQHESHRTPIGREIPEKLSEASLANANGSRGPARQQASASLGHGNSAGSDGGVVSNADSPRLSLPWSESLGADGQQSWRVPSTSDWWAVEPDVGRVAHGVPGRVDRLKQLGNSVVPQIPEIIGRAIMTRYAVASPHGGSL